MYACESNEEDQFDVIISEDLMKELGIKLDYQVESII